MKKNITSRMKSKKSKLAAGVLAIILGMFPWSATEQPVYGVDYTVGTGTAVNRYATFEALRGAAGTWATGGDTITIAEENQTTNRFVFDNSLTQSLNLNGANFTITRQGAVRANELIHVRSGGGADRFVNNTQSTVTARNTLAISGINIGDPNNANSGFTNTAVFTEAQGGTNTGNYGYNVTLSGVGFLNNKGQGAVYHSRGALTIREATGSRSWYAGNTDTAGGSAIGGAVTALNSDVVIANTDFGINRYGGGNSMALLGNSSVASGGALYIHDALTTGTPHSISNSTFFSNTATDTGGGVYVQAASLIVSNSVFGKNNAADTSVINYDAVGNTGTRGGGLFIEAGKRINGDYFSSQTLEVTSTTFNRNTANATDSSVTLVGGGAIHTLNTNTITVNNVLFDANTATQGSGGALAVTRNSNQSPTLLTLTGSNFYRNTANANVGHGGAVYMYNSSTNVMTTNITDTWFGLERNTTNARTNSAAEGGALYLVGGAASVNNQGRMVANLTGNTIAANIAMDGSGGGIWAQTATLNIGTATGNTANRFASNIATVSGGAIFGKETKITIGSATDTSIVNTFASNRVATGLLFDTPAGYGGAVYAINGSELTVYNANFTNADPGTLNTKGNSARYGGAIAVQDIGNVGHGPKIYDSTFTYNRAGSTGAGLDGLGGAIYVHNAVLTIDGSTFGTTAADTTWQKRGNIVTGSGGAVYAGQISNTANFSNGFVQQVIDSDFYRNKAFSNTNGSGFSGEVGGNAVMTRGGAIFAERVALSVQGSTGDRSQFVENVAAQMGLAPAAATEWKNGGGAIAITDDQTAAGVDHHARLTVNEASFLRNTAGVINEGGGSISGGGSGGAILANNTYSFSVANSDFTGNIAYLYRAAVGNDTGGYGGAVAIQRNVDDTRMPGVLPIVLPNSHTIKSATFTDNIAHTAGGAVSVYNVQVPDPVRNPILTVDIGGAGTDTVTFTTNQSVYGGAVYGMRSALNIVNSSFDGNAATTAMLPASALLAGGGAISVNEGILDIANNSLFTNNSSAYEGGAIQSIRSVVTIDATTFGDYDGANVSDGNSAVRGGALALHTTNGVAAVANPLWNRISDTNFYGNQAENTGVVPAANYNKYVRGGAIDVAASNLELRNADFIGNRAGVLTLQNNLVGMNLTDFGGGAIAISNDATTPAFQTALYIGGVNFEENTAVGYGGAILAKNLTGDLNQSGFMITGSNAATPATFTGNRAESFLTTGGVPGDGGSGGAVAIFKTMNAGAPLRDADHTVYGAVFTNNIANKDGGAIYLQTAGVGVTAAKLSIGADRTDPTNNNGLTRFVGNQARNGDGGAIYSENGNIYIVFSRFDGNIAGPNLNAVPPQAPQNLPASKGGAIAMNGGTLLIDDVIANQTVFTNNIASYRGGAVWAGNTLGAGAANPIVTINNAVFGSVDAAGTVGDGNVAVQGGAIYLAGPVGAGAVNNTHLIELSKFYDNEAKWLQAWGPGVHDAYGGAIAATDGANLEVKGSQFKENTVSLDPALTTVQMLKGGGAIAFYGGGNLRIGASNDGIRDTQTTFTENSAEGLGGAVHAMNATSVIINTSVFDGNVANKRDGGTQNSVSGSGGALAVQDSVFARVSGSQFTGNTALQNKGGAIYSTGSNLHLNWDGAVNPLTANTFTGNRALMGGAVFAATDGVKEVVIVHDLFDGNQALGTVDGLAGGGAVAVTGDNTGMLNMANATFRNNQSAGDGGAVFSKNTFVFANGPGVSTYDTNVATGDGGAIAVKNTASAGNANKLQVGQDGGTGTTVFQNNVATGVGGAIAAVNANVEINNATFGTERNGVSNNDFNTASGGGALAVNNAVHTVQNTVDIRNSRFNFNQATAGSGGAILVTGNNNALNVRTATKFLGNSATIDVNGNDRQGGGAIAIVDGGLGNLSTVAFVNGTTFESNTTTGQGGAIFAHNTAAINIDNSGYLPGNIAPVNMFIGNQAAGNGGAMSIYRDDASMGAGPITHRFVDTSFRDNQAGGNGGGISLVSTTAAATTLSIEAQNKNVVFENTAAGQGNDIYVDNAKLVFDAAGGTVGGQETGSVTIKGGFVGRGNVEKTGAGNLYVFADSSARDLAINAGNMVVGGNGNGGGEGLPYEPGTVVTVTNKATLASGAVLSVGAYQNYQVDHGNLGAEDAAIVANTFESLVDPITGQKGIININAFGKLHGEPSEDPSENDIFTLVKANNVITKGTYEFTVGGVPNAPGGPDYKQTFLWFNEYINDDVNDAYYNGTMIQLGAGLVWNMEDPDDAHGYFCIADGETFTLYSNLDDNENVINNMPIGGYDGWDGKSLTKICEGTLILAGQNGYTGTTTVENGTLVATSANSLGASAANGGDNIFIDERGTLQIGYYNNGQSNFADFVGTIDKTINDIAVGNAGGTVVIDAGPQGTATFTAANTYTGETKIVSGKARITNIQGFGDNADLDQVVRISAGASAEIAAAGTFSQNLTGAGSLIKSGNGVLTINRGNDYAGGTTVTGGVLNASSVSGTRVDALGTGTVTLVGGTLGLTQGGPENNMTYFENKITGNGNVDIRLADNNSWTTLTGADNDYTGRTNIFKGNLELTNVNATGRGGTINIDDADSILRLNIATDATVAYDNKIIGNGNLEKTGAGRIEIVGDNSYRGTTTVKEGTLAAGHHNATGTGTTIQVEKPGTFEVTYTGQFNKVVEGEGNFSVNSGNGEIVILSQNTYRGDTLLKSGTAVIRETTAFGANVGTRTVQMQGGSLKFDLSHGSQADNSFNQVITGANGTIVKSGNDVLYLTGDNGGFAGTTRIEGGTLVAKQVTEGSSNRVNAFGTGTVEVGGTARIELPAGTQVNEVEFVNKLTSIAAGGGRLELAPGAGKTVVLSGNSAGFTGSVKVESGNTKVTNINATGRNASLTDRGGDVTVLQGANLELAAAGDYFKKITGAGSVSKSGNGKLSLYNVNNYADGTTVKGGELAARNSKAVGDGVVTLESGIFSVLIDAVNDNDEFSNKITGTGNVKFGTTAGTLNLSSSQNDYRGDTTITQGTVNLTNLNATGANDGQYALQIGEDPDAENTTLIVRAEGAYNKKLTGKGTLEKNSTGELLLNGNNAGFTGTMHVKDGTLSLGNINALGNERAEVVMEANTTLGMKAAVGEGRIGNNVTLVDGIVRMNTEEGVDVTLSGEIDGAGTLNKTGAGSLALGNENNSFNGLNIIEGKVSAENQNAFGTGPVVNRSTMELVVKENTTLRDDISSEAGTFIKSGNGKLNMGTGYSPFQAKEFVMNGGSLEVQLSQGDKYYVRADQFVQTKDSEIVGTYNSNEGLVRSQERAVRFLALDGAGSSGFSSYRFNTNIARVNGRAVFEGNKTFFEVWLDSFLNSYGGQLSYNARQAAGAADMLADNDPLMLALNAYENEGGKMSKAFSSLHGEIYKSSIYATADLQRGFNEMLINRRLLCEHCREFKQIRGQYANTVQRELWATFTGGGNFRTEFDRFSGYNIGRWGVTGGLEHLFARGFFTGVAMGYEQADLDLSDLPQQDQFYAFRVSAYANYTIEDWSIVGFLGYTKNWHDVERNVDFLGVKSRGKYDDDVVTAGVELAKTYHWNSINVIPSIGLNLVHIRTPFITETRAGAANLFVHGDRYNSVRLPIGVRTNSKFNIQGVDFTPEFRLFYVPELAEDKVRGLTAFASSPGNAFVVDSGVRGSAVRIGIGMQAQLFDFMSIGVDYDAEVWSKYSRHDVGGNVKLRW